MLRAAQRCSGIFQHRHQHQRISLGFICAFSQRNLAVMPAAKRKRADVEVSKVSSNGEAHPPLKRRASARFSTTTAAAAPVANPDLNADVLDAPDAARASPDNEVNGAIIPTVVKQEVNGDELVVDGGKASKSKTRGKKKNATVLESKVSANVTHDGVPNGHVEVKSEEPVLVSKKVSKKGNDEVADPEGDDVEEADEEEVKQALSRPPPVNSDYLPLPWKGRLGYACLNTYLRASNPPVFSSRTCRIQSILEHRHPLQDPTQPEHPTKNRPDKTKPADVELGKRYVESLCLANVKDIIKMIRWNDRYNIKFLRLSSEMFPFASHPEYGYTLAPFASEALAEAGKVIAELGHRVTTHPGQFTQLGSPRKPVIENAIRDLEYHDELLSLLKLPEQQNKDAVMILHMGGMFEGKQETLQRFRENYVKLSQSVKNRLVLENDDMGWSVHDLLPICEELNIPMVLDYHHNNIVFDDTKMREGTRDIMDLYPRIKATWDRKGIRQKMHYSEPTPPAITPRQRRKHSPRVATLPPCPPDMDLMIEAKDKEQAVFELMRTFKLPGFETFNDVVPYTRNDDNKVALAELAKRSRSKKANASSEPEMEMIEEDDVGMGGPEGRVYWPPGMEEWLRPKKREVKKKEPAAKDKESVKKEAAEAYAAREAAKKATANGVGADEYEESDLDATPATKKAKAAMRKKVAADAVKAAAKPLTKPKGSKKVKPVPTPESSLGSLSELSETSESDNSDADVVTPLPKRKASAGRRGGGRSAKKSVNYADDDE